jgi:iron complex outermembrane receptor protein
MRREVLGAGCVGVFVLATAAAAQTADEAKDIGTVSAAAGASLSAPPAPGTAADVAPSRGPLDASQPTSVVGNTFIRENVDATANYDRIIQFTPSVQDVEPTGAGLQQNFAETIRGFNYTQFNTVFDGLVLPGLPTNFAPQSEAYFLPHDIGSVEVDRGPGTASTLGYATFGGTVSIKSIEPTQDPQAQLYNTYGSWGTRVTGLRLDSGAIADLGGARGTIDVEDEQGGGALSGTLTQRENIFGKLEIPVGDSTLVTLLGLYDYDRNHTPYGATLQQIQEFGPKYQLNGDPKSQAFADYNFDTYNTDFEYAGVQSDLGDGWGLDSKIYTNGYYQGGETGAAPNDPGTPNLTGAYYSRGQRITLSNNVPVLVKHNDFRDYGVINRVTKDTEIGQVRFGLWFDDIEASAYRYSAVGDLGLIPYSKKNTPLAIYNRLYDSALRTTQPYAEWALTPLPGLVVTPGIKYTETVRLQDAQVNSTTKVPANFAESYSALQPSVDARYTVLTGLVTYVQAAKGFLAPPSNVVQTLTPITVDPEQTWNYQAGVNFQRDAYTLSADVYYIDFLNKLNSFTQGSNTIYVNGGGAIYKGVELEGTVRLGYGVSAYGNYSINDAEYRGTHLPVELVPRNTAAAGFVLHQPEVFQEGDLVYGSLLSKFIGPQYTVATAQFPIPGYAYADAALGYTYPLQGGKRKIDVRINFDNISNDRSLIGVLGTTASNASVPLYLTDPGRSVFLTVSVTL